MGERSSHRKEWKRNEAYKPGPGDYFGVHSVEEGRNKLMEEAQVDAIIEDVFRNATEEELKNFKFSRDDSRGSLMSADVYKGKVGNHNITISDRCGGFHIFIDDKLRGEYDLNIEPELERSVGEPSGNRAIRKLFDKIATAQGHEASPY